METRFGLEKEGFLREILPDILVCATSIIIYFILPSKMMASEILIMSMPVLGFILLLGYTGLLSFCTGGLFAVGAYTAGILLARYDVHIFVAMFAGIVMSGIAATIVGYFCIKQGGMSFGLLTLAFNQVIWFTIYQWKSVTGGPDGIVGISRSNLDLGVFMLNLRPSFTFFVFVLIFSVLLFIFARRFTESPFGKVLVSLRESELRAKAIGYNPATYKWIAFVVSGMVCGLGGVLFALHQEYVGEHIASFMASGDIMIMALLGGTFSLYGALVGSAVFIFLADFLNQFTALSKAGAWLLIFGLIFILVVMFLRGGIYGGVEKIIQSAWRKQQ